jgi:aminopeptidase N
MQKWILALILTASVTMGKAQNADDFSALEQKKFVSLRDYDEKSVASPNFDINYYRCDWKVDPAVKFIAGSVTSKFTITSATNTLVYDLNKALTVDSVVYHGVKINFVHASTHALQVSLPATLSVNTLDSLTIFYRGVPPNNGAFVTSTHNTVPVLWTLSEPYGSSSWWPCRDLLKDKADSIDIFLTHPANYVSSSNGVVASVVDFNAQRTTHWKHRYPITTYLVAIAVTNYNVVNDAITLPTRTMPVSMYAYPEAAATFVAATNVAKFCLQEFSKLVTEYPFVQERYAQTQFGVGGGMEHQTNSFIGSAGSGLVAHELAHQWFGDKVTCGSWTDIWLNEGFASYMEYVYVELTNPSGKLNFLQSWRNNITSSAGGSVFVPDTLNEARIFDARLSYRKGGYLLHMLRWKLGDSTFFRGVRRYLNDPAVAFKTAMTADLKRNLEQESGQDLTEFLNDWFMGQGYPDYGATWSQKSNFQVQVQLNQTTSHTSVPFYEMPVPLRFIGATKDTTIVVNHTSSGQTFILNPGFEATTMQIDPELWILSKIKTVDKVAAPLNTELKIYPNPTRGKLSVLLPESVPGNITIRLFNSAGQRVYEKAVTPSGFPIEISTLKFASGVYYLQLTGNYYKVSRKIMVSNK